VVDRLDPDGARRARAGPGRREAGRARQPPGPAWPDRRALARPGRGAAHADRPRRGAHLLVAHRDPRSDRADLHVPARVRAERRAARQPGRARGRRDRNRRRRDVAGRRRGRWRGGDRRRPDGHHRRLRLRRRGVVPQAQPHGGRACGDGRWDPAGRGARDPPARPHPHPRLGAGARRCGLAPDARDHLHRHRVRDLPLARRERRALTRVAGGLHRARLLDLLRRGPPRRELHARHRARAGADPRRLLAGGGRRAARTPPRCRGRG
jgi:hypothetical protein